ncbi:MAG TPA: MaoC family dehydratase [Geobacteraceae bacterium]|nr:MaoC family dehydratase [Geobacteraceae bacterium]
MTAVENLVAIYREKIGTEVHLGEWLTLDQERINAFAAASGDQQWIHTDPQRAAAESPYGSTVAHGFLTLSLIPLLTGSNAAGSFEKNYPGMRLRVNYGLDKVRFPSPVVTGSRIRARSVVTGVEEVAGGVQISYRITVEVEGGGKPACVAEQLFRLYP